MSLPTCACLVVLIAFLVFQKWVFLGIVLPAEVAEGKILLWHFQLLYPCCSHVPLTF